MLKLKQNKIKRKKKNKQNNCNDKFSNLMLLNVLTNAIYLLKWKFSIK